MTSNQEDTMYSIHAEVEKLNISKVDMTKYKVPKLISKVAIMATF